MVRVGGVADILLVLPSPQSILPIYPAKLFRVMYSFRISCMGQKCLKLQIEHEI